MDLKRRVYQILEIASPEDRASRWVDGFILVLIGLNVVAVIIETVGPIERRFGGALQAFETFSVAVFTVEYVLRLWSVTTNAKYAHSVTGRLKFLFTPMALVDLMAVLPALLPFVGFDLRQLRVLRLFRLFRLAKLFRYSRSLRIIGYVLVKRRGELLSTVILMLMLLIISASALYFAERDAQPEAFSSIPAAMWWAIATLTTVGYGDVYPVTALGRALAAVVAIFGIGLFALPTGVLGAAFTDELDRERSDGARHGGGRRAQGTCPHCGGPIGHPNASPHPGP